MLFLVTSAPGPDMGRGLLVLATFLFIVAIAARTFAAFVLVVYWRGVRSGQVPRWAFHLERIRRYMAWESLDDIRGPGTIESAPCFGGVPGQQP